MDALLTIVPPTGDAPHGMFYCRPCEVLVGLNKWGDIEHIQQHVKAKEAQKRHLMRCHAFRMGLKVACGLCHGACPCPCPCPPLWTPQKRRMAPRPAPRDTWAACTLT